jgi:hypothetical protein
MLFDGLVKFNIWLPVDGPPLFDAIFFSASAFSLALIAAANDGLSGRAPFGASNSSQSLLQPLRNDDTPPAFLLPSQTL